MACGIYANFKSVILACVINMNCFVLIGDHLRIEYNDTSLN